MTPSPPRHSRSCRRTRHSCQACPHNTLLTATTATSSTRPTRRPPHRRRHTRHTRPQPRHHRSIDHSHPSLHRRRNTAPSRCRSPCLTHNTCRSRPRSPWTSSHHPLIAVLPHRTEHHPSRPHTCTVHCCCCRRGDHPDRCSRMSCCSHTLQRYTAVRCWALLLIATHTPDRSPHRRHSQSHTTHRVVGYPHHTAVPLTCSLVHTDPKHPLATQPHPTDTETDCTVPSSTVARCPRQHTPDWTLSSSRHPHPCAHTSVVTTSSRPTRDCLSSRCSCRRHDCHTAPSTRSSRSPASTTTSHTAVCCRWLGTAAAAVLDRTETAPVCRWWWHRRRIAS